MSDTLRFLVGLLILVAMGFGAGTLWQGWSREQSMIAMTTVHLNEAIRHPDTVQRVVSLSTLRGDVTMIYQSRSGIYAMVIGNKSLALEADIGRSLEDNIRYCLTREKDICPLRLAAVSGQLISKPYQRDLAAIEMARMMLSVETRGDAEGLVNAIQEPILQSYGYELLAKSWDEVANGAERAQDLWQKSLMALRNAAPGIDRANSTAFLVNALIAREGGLGQNLDAVKSLLVQATNNLAEQPPELPTALSWLQLIAAAAPIQQLDLVEPMVSKLAAITTPETATTLLQAHAILLPLQLASAGSSADIRARLIKIDNPAERAMLLAVLAQSSLTLDSPAVAQADLDLAITAARTLPPEAMLPELVVEMVASYAALGFNDQAVQLVSQLKTDSSFYHDAVLEIGRYGMIALKPDDARQWLAKLPPESRQAAVLQKLIDKPGLDKPGSDLAKRVGQYYLRSWKVNAESQEEAWAKAGLFNQTAIFARETEQLRQKILAAGVAQNTPPGTSQYSPVLEKELMDMVDKALSIATNTGPAPMAASLQSVCPGLGIDCPVDAAYLRAWVIRRMVVPMLTGLPKPTL